MNSLKSSAVSLSLTAIHASNIEVRATTIFEWVLSDPAFEALVEHLSNSEAVSYLDYSRGEDAEITAHFVSLGEDLAWELSLFREELMLLSHEASLEALVSNRLLALS